MLPAWPNDALISRQGFKLQADWADDVITMSMILRGRNLPGVLWAGAMALRLWVKRQIKMTPQLHHLSQALRRMLFGTRQHQV